MARPRRKAKQPVLLIGAGRMGGALLKGWLASGRFAPIHVVEKHPTTELVRLKRAKKISLHERVEAAKLPRAPAVIALKPQVIRGHAEILRELGKSGGLVLSIAAGITTSLLRAGLGGGSAVIRAMPNTPGAIGRGITVLYGERLTPSERAMAEGLMAPLGETLWLPDEALMDAVTALSGSGPAYIFLMVEALAAAGRAEGLDAETAERLARATVAGSGALLDADPRAASLLRDEVTSPGGTTEAALKRLMGENGLMTLMREAVAAAARRGKELGS
jgi:pyrroline-5-carboxylate reductase